MHNSPLFKIGMPLKGTNLSFGNNSSKPKPAKNRIKVLPEPEKDEIPFKIERKSLNKFDTSRKNIRAYSYSSRNSLNKTNRTSFPLQQQTKPQHEIIPQQKKQLIKKRLQTHESRKSKIIRLPTKPKKCTCGDCDECLKDFQYFLHIFPNDLTLPEISSKSWCIWRKGKNNRFVHYYGKRVHKVREIASLTKMITAMTTIDFLNKHQYNPNNIRFSVKKGCIQVRGTSADLKMQQSYTITELLYGLMLPSGNDAAIALSQGIGLLQSLKMRNKSFNPSEANWQSQHILPHRNYSFLFHNLMNEKCQRMGLLDTHLYNSHGNDAYDHVKNVSTCHEIGKVSAELMCKYEFLRRIIITKKFSVERYNKVWVNTNKLLDDGFLGIKTGITDSAGPCLAAAYGNFIIVVLNSKSMDQRWIEVKKLARWIFRKGF